jgi:transcription antitermination factor NusG
MELSTRRVRDSVGGATSIHEEAYQLEKDSHKTPITAQWYAIQTRRQFEKKADRHLHGQGVETFLPLLRQVHRWSDRRKVVEVPLFAGYAFLWIEICSHARQQVLQTPGVIGFVGPQNRPTPVPASQIIALRRLLEADVECGVRPFPRTGQRVRIRSGSLDGVEGILQQNDHGRLVISIECIQRSVAVRIEGYDLEVI